MKHEVTEKEKELRILADLIKNKNAAVDKDGKIVDSRENPEAVKIQQRTQ